MMSRLSEEAKAEIREAIRIIREDREKTPPEDPAVTKTPAEGDPPPVKDKPAEKPKKKGIYWGDRA
jgi:hypothetical protein